MDKEKFNKMKKFIEEENAKDNFMEDFRRKIDMTLKLNHILVEAANNFPEEFIVPALIVCVCEIATHNKKCPIDIIEKMRRVIIDEECPKCDMDNCFDEESENE